jgi:hypothetical protein
LTGEKITLAAQKTGEVAESAARVVSDAGKKAVDHSVRASSMVAGKFAEAASATGETLGNAGVSLKGAVVEGANAVTQKTKASATAVKDVSSEYGQKFSSVTKTAASEVVSIGNITAGKLGAGLNTLKSAVGKPFIGAEISNDPKSLN